MARRKFICAIVCTIVGLASPGVKAQSAATPRHGGIVFVGSSIFQFWHRLPEQMAPLPVLNLAIAGTVTQDWLNRVGEVAAYQPRIVVFYAGSNDVSAGEEAGPIIRRTQQFVSLLHAKSPDTFFYYTSINKAPEKRDRWNVVDAVNLDMQEFSVKNPNNAGYIELNTVLFDAQGNVHENLFLPDGLHFRPLAYEEFARIVKPILLKAWENGVGVAKPK